MFCYIFRLSYSKNKEKKTACGNNCAIVSRSGYIWVWSEARDQESTNHGAHFVEWKSDYITIFVVLFVSFILLIGEMFLFGWAKRKRIIETFSNFPLPSCSWSDESTELMEPDRDLVSEPIESVSFLSMGSAFPFLNEPVFIRGLGRGLALGSSRLMADDEPVILNAL